MENLTSRLFSTRDRVCTLTGGSVLGVLFGFFCPLCVPASAAFFSSIGLAFLPQKQVVFPLIGVLSAVFLYGLFKGLQRHRNISPMLFGLLGVAAIPLGRYIIASAVLTYLGAFCVLSVSIWNAMLQRSSMEPRYQAEPLESLLNETA